MNIFKYYIEQKKSVSTKPTAQQKRAVIMLLICMACFMASFIVLAMMDGGFNNKFALALTILTLVLAPLTLKATLKALDQEAEQEGLAALTAFEKTEKKFGKKKTKAAVIKSKEETFKAKLEKGLTGTLLVTALTFFGNTPIKVKVGIAIFGFIGLTIYYFTNAEQREKDAFYLTGKVYFDIEEEEK